MCSTDPFKFRWPRWYICNSSYYHHQVGSNKLSHRCHSFPWLCLWGRCTITFCRLGIISITNCSLMMCAKIGHIKACRSHSFVCILTDSLPFCRLEGILPKGPYLPCVSMAGRAVLAGYHRPIWRHWAYKMIVRYILSISLQWISRAGFYWSLVFALNLRVPFCPKEA